MPRSHSAGRDLPDHPVQRTVPANSVFQQGQLAAGKPPRQNHQPPDIGALKVYDKRPLPNVTSGRGALSIYARIYDELLTEPGKSVDLTPQQAKSMISWSKKNGKKLATRRLGPDVAGVWRLK